MASDSPSPSLFLKENLFIGVSANEAQANYEALRNVYGAGDHDGYLLDDYFHALAPVISADQLSWMTPTGKALDDSRHALCERIAETAGSSVDPQLINSMNFMTNYLIDYGRRDLYYGTVPGTHMGIMALGPAHGLDDDYALLLSKATAQMLNTESEAGYANKAFTLAHRQVIANEDETVYKLDGLAELSRPLIELTALAFRNCAFTLMGGTPKPDSIKAYEPPLYDLLVAKLEIIKDPYMIRNLITKETFIEVRDVPKFPPPAPNL